LQRKAKYQLISNDTISKILENSKLKSYLVANFGTVGTKGKIKSSLL
jgi:hypothetical protein